MRLSGRSRALALAAALALAPLPALGHAVLLTSQPADGAVLETSPAAISLTFNEPVRVTLLQVAGTDGTVIQASEEWELTNQLTWTLPASLAEGGWLMSWRVISIDSHPVSGSLRLAVGDADARFVEPPPETGRQTQYPRFVMLAGTLLAVGLLLAGPFLGRPATRSLRAAAVGALLAAVAGSVWFILATAAAVGGGAAALRAALDVLGPGALVVVAALLAGAGLVRSHRPRPAALCGLAALAGLGLGGHVAGAPPAWLSRPTHLVHAAAGALWLGSLLVLLDRRDPAGSGTAEALARFSRIAPWMLGLLVAAGAVLIVVQAGTPATLAASQYGLMLGVKLSLVLLLLILAAYNRWRLTRPALAGDPRGEAGLRRSIRAELALFVAILGATALIGSSVPPRSLVAAAPACNQPGPVERVGADIGLEVTLVLDSACAGRNLIGVSFRWTDGAAVEPEEVMLRFSLPDLNIEPFDVYIEAEDGAFTLSNYDLPLPGEWRVEARVLLDQYTLRRVSFRVPLAAP